MRAMAVEYHAPARFDDLLEVFVRISRIGRSSVTYEFAAYRRGRRADGDGDADARARRHGGTGRPCDPGLVARALRAFEGGDLEE